MAAHNKGKVLRNGHYVRRRPYRPRVPRVSHGPWVSAVTGRVYASEKQMIAAEKASKRMKNIWLLKKFDEKLPIPWEALPGWLRHQDRDGDTLVRRLFYQTSGNWQMLNSSMIDGYLAVYGLEEKDEDDRTLKELITELMDRTEDETERQVPIWLQ